MNYILTIHAQILRFHLEWNPSTSKGMASLQGRKFGVNEGMRAGALKWREYVQRSPEILSKYKKPLLGEKQMTTREEKQPSSLSRAGRGYRVLY